ncbi:uncharacterized protein LOC131167576 [Malania oleifera]|uniref:uncharacterized protein LOC131167576 n=1 Tax=Malania oleifera TaxID=397392 RepID=UPI0025AEBB58|nr:uncharacterized protein LOC131167576 [Malania oleifera]
MLWPQNESAGLDLAVHGSAQKLDGLHAGPDASALALKGPGGPSQRPQRGKIWCEHCRKKGHSKNTCWEIHGKPADWRPRQYHKNRGYQANTGGSTKRPQGENNDTPSGSVFSLEQLDQLYKMFSSMQTSGQSSSGSLALRDLSLGKTIGTAKAYEGLYYFEEASLSELCNTAICDSASTSKNSELLLWLSRMGHPNFQYLKRLFPSLYSNKMASEFQCEDVAQEFKVQAMFVLYKQGKEVDRVIGAKKDELEKKIERYRTPQAKTLRG